MAMNNELKELLRQIIYHKLKMWDASSQAEKLLGEDLDTDGVDYFCAGMDDAENALTLSEQSLKEAFELTDEQLA